MRAVLTDVVEAGGGRSVEGVGVSSRDGGRHLSGRAAVEHVAVAAN